MVSGGETDIPPLHGIDTNWVSEVPPEGGAATRDAPAGTPETTKPSAEDHTVDPELGDRPAQLERTVVAMEGLRAAHNEAREAAVEAALRGLEIPDRGCGSQRDINQEACAIELVAKR